MANFIQCPKCNKKSYSLGDIKHKFCRDCGFHDTLLTPEQMAARIELLELQCAKHALEAIDRICHKCGEDMGGNDHDVCWKCECGRLTEKIERLCDEIGEQVKDILSQYDEIKQFEAKLAVRDPQTPYEGK